jgi:hypothetical protein
MGSLIYLTSTALAIRRPAAKTGTARLTTLSFSGYTWSISAPSGLEGPGPNYWNASYAFVDANTYQWQVEGTLGSFDKNIVLGLFNYSGNDGYDEMDAVHNHS